MLRLLAYRKGGLRLCSYCWSIGVCCSLLQCTDTSCTRVQVPRLITYRDIAPSSRDLDDVLITVSYSVLLEVWQPSSRWLLHTVLQLQDCSYKYCDEGIYVTLAFQQAVCISQC